MERLEDLHMLAIQIDACQSAAEAIFQQLPWPTGNPYERRQLNQLAHFMGAVSETSWQLLADVSTLMEEAIATQVRSCSSPST